MSIINAVGQCGIQSDHDQMLPSYWWCTHQAMAMLLQDLVQTCILKFFNTLGTHRLILIYLIASLQIHVNSMDVDTVYVIALQQL